MRNQPTFNIVNAYCSVEYSVAPQHGKSKQITKENIRIYFFLIFINNLSVTKAVYPAKSQNHQLKISKLGFINKQVKTDLSIFT